MAATTASGGHSLTLAFDESQNRCAAFMDGGETSGADPPLELTVTIEAGSQVTFAPADATDRVPDSVALLIGSFGFSGTPGATLELRPRNNGPTLKFVPEAEDDGGVDMGMDLCVVGKRVG